VLARHQALAGQGPVDRLDAPRLVHGGAGRHRVRDQVDGVVLAGLAQVHDPSAIDTVRFRMSVAFVWPAIAKPRRRGSRPS
jgi:IS4 transposase